MTPSQNGKQGGAEDLSTLLERSSKLVNDYLYAIDQSAIVAVTDLRGRITHANDKFCEISKFSLDELLGQDHRLINSGYHGPDFFRGLWSDIASGMVWRGEIRNRAKEGGIYWVDTTIVPFFDEKGRPYQYLSIRFDITDKKTAQAKIVEEQMRALHAEKMASLGELAAGIAHELGNPLASIMAWLSVFESQLDKGSLNLSDFANTVPGVVQKAERMSKIIRGMLAYARDGSKDPFDSVNLLRVINEVVEYSQHRMNRVGVDVRVKVRAQALDVECRETEISQILVNLLINACDATKDLEERWIEIEVEDFQGGLAIAVTDSGTGIPEEIRAKVMEPFFTTKPPGKGTGLGLSISRQQAQHHHGSLDIDAASPHTRFVLRLPHRQPRQSQ